MHINAGYSRLDFLVIFSLVVVILWQPAVAQSVSLPECTVDIEDNDDDGSLDDDGADGTIDIDKDGDGLIEICDLEGLNEIRYQLDGSGYTTSTDATRLTQGCPDNGCIGYELVRSLDFASAASYGSGTTNMAWTTGAGWQPIGSNDSRFSGIFEGNGFTISGLYINRPAQDLIGLFAVLGSGSEIKNVGLLDINVQGNDHVSGLVGENNGSITNSYASGTVTGNNNIGGLVGFNNNRIINSYASGAVSGNAVIGGLVGLNNIRIISSYATGTVDGNSSIGGLVGESYGSIINSYATGTVTGDNNIGGLVGFNNNRITNSYASGAVSGNTVVGGLVGIHLGHLSNAYATGNVSLTSTSETNTSDSSLGGLVGQWIGQLLNQSSIRNSYAIGRVIPGVDNAPNAGGLVGTAIGTTVGTANYWDVNKSDWTISAGGGVTSRTTMELQSPIAPGTTSTEVYYGWSIRDWDFGNSQHYPALHYASGPDEDACNADVTTPSDLPQCGILLPGQHGRDRGLAAVFFLADGGNEEVTIEVAAPFSPLVFEYDVTILNPDINAVQIKPFVINDNATIAITKQSDVFAFNYFANKANDELSTPISLDNQTTLTIVITDIIGDRTDNTTYTFAITRVMPLVIAEISVNPSGIIDEGSIMTITFTVSGGLGEYEYAYELDGEPLPSPSRPLLQFTIPTNIVARDRATQTVEVNIIVSDGMQMIEHPLVLTIRRVGNVSLSSEVNASRLSVIFAITDTDDDGVVSYQWQQLELGGEWTNIAAATTPTYWLPADTDGSIRYRVNVSHTDGQGYMAHYQQGPFRAGDLDNDDDGLIEIYYLEDVNAMRYQLAGRGYQASTDAAVSMLGCPVSGCNGYELRRDLDFNVAADYSPAANKAAWTTGAGWQPIGSRIEPFSAIFDGNGYTISGLYINRSDFDIGLYAVLRADGEIKNVGLLDVNVQRAVVYSDEDDLSSLVGGLVSGNYGSIINSYASGTVSGESNTGGLVGENGGSITNSYASVAVTATNRNIGGLVGINIPIHSNNGSIINSYATGTVSGDWWVGGLVGSNSGNIISSFAYADVIGRGNEVGGLVGNNNGVVINSYATGAVIGVGGEYIGGLVGSRFSGSIINSYAISRVMPLSNDSYWVGGLAGGGSGRVIASYWDKTVNAGLTTSSGAKTTAELITPTAPGATPADTYYGWSTAAWDFGDRIHYPSLYYATTDSITVSACADNPTPSSALPRCGSLIPNQAIRDLISALGVSEITISSHPPANDDGTIDEGSDVTLSFDVTGGTGNYEYVYLMDDIPLLRSSTQSFVYKIAEDFLSADVSTQNVTFKVIIAHDGALITSRSEVLTIRKVDNGSPDIALDVNPARLSIRSVRADPDGEGTFTYIWQKLDITDTRWITIDDATTATYNFPEGASGSIRYRVDVKYVDGQGYGIDYAKGAQQKSFILMPLRVDIDIDDDGLIEIYYLEDLDAIRYQLDGTAYKANADAAAITTGCPDRGGGEVCNGYELARSLDFNNPSHYEAMEINSAWTTATGWMPIANNSVRFDSVFEGNGFTISGLYIARQFEENLGLFSVLGSDSVVKNFGLLDVSIVGADHIGGLVGQNFGTIINSYVATATVVSRANTGGLVSSNSGNIISSFAYADVIGLSSLGGLVGVNGGNIINTYAAGTVASTQTVIHAGGLVGSHSLLGSIRNSYAISRMMPLTDGSSQVGGLVGNALSSITASYWDKTVNADLATSDDAKTTAELRNPTAPGATSADTYYGWRTAAWDFGDRIHYPILYYATTDSITVSACADNPLPSSALPRCGSRIPNQAVRNLISVLEISEVTTSSQPMANNDGTINEGSNVNLMVNATAGSGVYNFAWSQTSGRTLELEGSTSTILSFTIPIDFVELDATTAAITFQIEVSDGFTTASLSKVVTIAKIDNGSPAIKTDADAARLRVSLVEPDADGEGYFSLQWQSQVPGRDWTDITGATTPTYWLPASADDADDSRIRYRAFDIIYTDGQGYETKYDNQGPFLSAIELTGEIGGGEAQTNERETLVLTAPTVRGGSEVYSYAWTYSAEDSAHLSGHSTLALAGTTATVHVAIPADFIALKATSANIIFKVIVNDGFTTTSLSKVVTIAKIDNGSSPAIKTDADASRLRVSLVEPDADGEGYFSLQWQSQVPEGEWMNITSATTATYGLPADRNQRIRYRAIDISYTDGQGYGTEYDDQGPFPGAIEATGDISGDARVNEGEILVLTAPTVRGGSGVYSYEWTQIADKIFIATLNVAIPADFIALEATSTNITFKVIVDDGFTTTSRSKVVTIVKIDNGSPAIKTDVNASRLSVSLVEPDPDGEGGFSLQWQSQVPEGEWIDITGATTATYWLPPDTDGSIRYRVNVSHTDGQGYMAHYQQGPFRAGDLDNDDDGLIEIYYLEDVNAMRYQLAGRGYQASTEAAVSMLGCPVSGCNGYELRRDLDFNNDADYIVISNREVWTTGTSWQPIGSNASRFSAIFDGNGYTISGLYINRPAQDHIGLFGELGSGSEIKNVGILDIDVKGSDFIGGLVGLSYGNIINSYVTGVVTGHNNIGGLVGSNFKDITNSNAVVTVSGNRDVGGLVGENNDDSNIIDSYASGAVSGNQHVGGLVGENNDDSNIINSYATGMVSGGIDSIGGLVGTSKGAIINSYATGMVSGNSNIGGLVGDNSRSSITNSYATGTVSGNSDIGGLVGDNSRSSITNSYATGTVIGNSVIGGLVGYNYRSSITNSYAISRVMPLTNDSSGVGGLVGQVYSSVITASYWDKTVNAGLMTSSGAKTTAELLTPTAPGATPADTYYGWSTAAWDFGDRIYYPSLYYATTDSIAVSACADNPLPSSVLPRCGSLIPNQAIRDLISALGVSEITISSHPPANDDGTIDEGSDVTLSFDVTGGTGNYEYVYLIDDTPLLRSNTQPFVYKIAEDFLSADVSTQNVTFKVIARDGALITSRSEVLTIRKIDNGSPDIELDVSSARLSIRSVRADPDGEGTFTYIWQKLDITDTSWITIDDATTATYNLPEGASGSIRYRVDVKYVDGQGYGIDYAKGAQQKSFILMPLRADIDIDDDGLIEIYYLEDLDAIRYQLDGTAYKANADAAAITTGCPDRGGGEVCNGYELARSLDFNNLSHYEAMEINSAWTTATTGWMPIANNSVRFDSVFEGNGFTISGLYIARQFEENLGLFSVLGSDSVVKNFGLLDVSIVGADHIGGLVGQNFGTIINSYVATATVVSRANTGGLVSSNSGNIISSFAYADVIGLSSLGGLVGVNGGNIINTYAAGTVASTQPVIHAGGLVGSHSLLGSIRNSYAVSRMMPLTDGSSQVGGLVGNARGSITASYWDKTVNADLATSDDAKTTAELLTPTAPGLTSADTYYGWRTAAWDFGDRIHYPTLYYATTDSITVSVCAANPAPSSALPRCGSRIPNQAVRNLISVLKVSEVATSSQPVANNDGTINEGSNVNLMVNATAGSGVYNFAWSQTSGRTLELEGSTSATLSFTIPIDFVELNATTTAITFQVEVDDGFTTTSRSKVVTIAKIDNGAPAIDFVETTKTLIAIVGSDPDGEGSITYHWEQRNLAEESWTTITSAITATYQLPEVPNGSTLYRVNVSHTDGQGYVTTATGGPFRPSAVAGLIALDISTSAILVPKFTADIFTYVLKVAADANELSLTPTASTGSIVYSVNGGADQAVARGQPFTVALTEEIQTITITVKLQDGSSKSAVYTISKIERVIFTNVRLFLEGLLP